MTFPEELDMSIFIDVEDEVKICVLEKSSLPFSWSFLLRKFKGWLTKAILAFIYVKFSLAMPMY